MPAMTLEFGTDTSAAKEGVRQFTNFVRGEADAIGKSFRDNLSNVMPKLLIGGIGGIAAAMGVDKLLDMLVASNRELAKMAEHARRAGLTTDRYQSLRFAANLGGVSDATFGADVDDLAKRLDKARSGENDLTKLLEANNIKYKDRKGEIIDINKALEISFDLINRGRSAFDKEKIAGMLGLSADWVKLAEQGYEAFSKAADAAGELGVVTDREVIAKAEKFNTEWAKSGKQWSAQMRAALLEWLPLLDDAVEKAAGLLGKLKDLKSPVDPEGFIERNVLALARWRSGADNVGAWETWLGARDSFDSRFGGMSPAGRTPAQVTVNKPPPGGYTNIPSGGASGSGGGRDAFDRAVHEAEKRIAVIEAETRTIGLNSEARDRAILVAKLEEQAKLANAEAGVKSTEITAEQRKEIDRLAAAMEAAGKRQREMRDAWQGTQDAMKFAGNQLADVIMAIGDRTKSMADVGRAALRAFTAEMLRAALVGEGAFAKLFGLNAATTGGVGGLFGMIAKGFAGGFAEGGYIPPGKFGVVGERGMEFVVGGHAGKSVIPMGGGGGASYVDRRTFQFNSGITPTDRAWIESSIAAAIQISRSLAFQDIRGALATNANALG